MSRTETDIQVFDFGGRKVRTAGTHDAPLFCAADVCAVLSISDVSDACSRLDGDELEALQMPIMVPMLVERQTDEVPS